MQLTADHRDQRGHAKRHAFQMGLFGPWPSRRLRSRRGGNRQAAPGRYHRRWGVSGGYHVRLLLARSGGRARVERPGHRRPGRHPLVAPQGLLVATPTATLVATNQIWATTLLVDAGLPTTSNNIDNVMRWMVNEEPASNWWDRNNPLNASLGTSASDGTGSYPSLTVGAQYTAAMLRQQNMAPIFNALAANAPPATFGAAVISSPWASSHYGGNVSRFTGAVPPVVTYTGQTLVASPGTPTPSNPTGAVQGAPGTCSANTGGLDIPGAGWIGTPCQIKAFTGGLLIGVGGFTLLVGAVLIASYGLKNTSVGAAVGKVAGGP